MDEFEIKPGQVKQPMVFFANYVFTEDKVRLKDERFKNAKFRRIMVQATTLFGTGRLYHVEGIKDEFESCQCGAFISYMD